MVGKYRKKPVVIEAMEWRPEDPKRTGIIIGWLCARGFADFYREEDKSLTIGTLEGKMRCDIGDYIIRGVNGEFYSCRADIFHKTYDAVDGKDEE